MSVLPTDDTLDRLAHAARPDVPSPFDTDEDASVIVYAACAALRSSRHADLLRRLVWAAHDLACDGEEDPARLGAQLWADVRALAVEVGRG